MISIRASGTSLRVRVVRLGGLVFGLPALNLPLTLPRVADRGLFRDRLAVGARGRLTVAQIL